MPFSKVAVGLVRLEAVRQRDRSAEAAAADLLEDVTPSSASAPRRSRRGWSRVPFSTVMSTSSGLMPGSAASIVSGSLVVVTSSGSASPEPPGRTVVVIEKAVHRLAKRHELPRGDGRRTIVMVRTPPELGPSGTAPDTDLKLNAIVKTWNVAISASFRSRARGQASWRPEAPRGVGLIAA